MIAYTNCWLGKSRHRVGVGTIFGKCLSVMQHPGKVSNRSSPLKDLLKRCWKNTWYPLSSLHLLPCLTVLPSPCFLLSPSSLFSPSLLPSFLFGCPHFCTYLLTPQSDTYSPRTTTVPLTHSPSPSHLNDNPIYPETPILLPHTYPLTPQPQACSPHIITFPLTQAPSPSYLDNRFLPSDLCTPSSAPRIPTPVSRLPRFPTRAYESIFTPGLTLTCRRTLTAGYFLRESTVGSRFM